MNKITINQEGSIPLQNAQHEKFAAHVAGGTSLAQAYLDAGYTGKNKYKLSQLLGNREDIQLRVAWLRAQHTKKVIEDSALSKAWVMNRLQEIVERCMQREAVIIDGEPSGEYKFNASAALKGLELIGKEFGMYDTSKDRTVIEEEYTAKTIPELTRDAEYLTRRLKRVTKENQSIKTVDK